MSTKELCVKYFGTDDLYKLLKVKKAALEKDIKKAYYKLSLEVHPDRVKDEEKEEATEKFKLLSKVYQVLTDVEKRTLYDEQGIIADDDDFWGSSTMADMLNLWRTIFKPLTISDIDEYKQNYIGSELELMDIKGAYIRAEGCINKILNTVPFLTVEDEPRLHKIVDEMIKNGEVPEYEIFTNEPKQKRSRRHKKAQREHKEADEHKKEMEERSGSLEKALLQRQEERGKQFGSMLQNLINKYGNGEDEEEGEAFEISSMKLKKIKKKLNSSTQKKNESPTKKLHNVKKGKVKKGKN